MKTSVELEQIFEGAYFLQNGERIRIRPSDLGGINEMIRTLEPILISHSELSLLRFSTLDMSQGHMSKSTSTGGTLGLKVAMGGRWFLVINGHLTTIGIHYIHQLQRLYFSMFEEHLRYGNDPMTPDNKPSLKYVLKPSTEMVRVQIPKNDPRYTDPRIRLAKDGFAYKNVFVPVVEDDYYVTYDLRYLMRTASSFAIWAIIEHSPLFNFKNRNWGLKLVAGKTVTQLETESAGRWLHDHLLANKVSINYG